MTRRQRGEFQELLSYTRRASGVSRNSPVSVSRRNNLLKLGVKSTPVLMIVQRLSSEPIGGLEPATLLGPES